MSTFGHRYDVINDGAERVGALEGLVDRAAANPADVLCGEHYAFIGLELHAVRTVAVGPVLWFLHVFEIPKRPPKVETASELAVHIVGVMRGAPLWAFLLTITIYPPFLKNESLL